VGARSAEGVPQIEVIFDVAATGIVNVAAKDMANGKDQKITITSSSGLSKQDIERMAKEAGSHATDDKIRREQIEAKNQLDFRVYNLEKMLRDHGDQISGSERGEVEHSLRRCQEVLESADKHQIDPRASDTGIAQARGADVQEGTAAKCVWRWFEWRCQFRSR
jgi:molecular chaperone DnaK (HSP70)